MSAPGEEAAIDAVVQQPSTRGIARITVMAPMRNEAGHIEGLVADIASQDFAGEIEFLVADGGSTDGSADLLQAAARRRGFSVTVLDNPDRLVSHGLNRCIKAATGDLLVRVDCHSRYPPDYLRQCAAVSEETGAENVGGIFVPVGRSTVERAVACAMNGPFGGVHWTRHGESRRVEVDTVPYGAFRPAVFQRIGLFDESLVRNQDDELNLRLRIAGGRIVQDPSIRIVYTPRGSLRGVFRQYFEYGFWKPAVMRKHRRRTSARSLVPVAFVVTLVVLALLAPWFAAARWLLVAAIGIYLVAATIFATDAVRRCKESWRLLPAVTATFPTFHFAHGLGFLLGAARTGLRRPPERLG